MPTENHKPGSLVPFVVLYHEIASGNHYDLMIDSGDALATWRVDQPPEIALIRPVPCVRIADHRKVYLDYEGPVSGDRGRVTRYDRGQCRLVLMAKDRWIVRLEGERLSGAFQLLREVHTDQWSLSRLET